MLSKGLMRRILPAAGLLSLLGLMTPQAAMGAIDTKVLSDPKAQHQTVNITDTGFSTYD